MNIKHCILVKKGDDTVGRFLKTLEMPCVPPVGTFLHFGANKRGFPQRVLELSFSEEHEIFQAYYEIDIYAEQDRLNDHVSDDFFPRKLVCDFGFSIDWINEQFEDVRKALESS
jgi:hypothetical protein